MAKHDWDEFSAFDIDVYGKDAKPEKEEQATTSEPEEPVAPPSAEPAAETATPAQQPDGTPSAADMPVGVPEAAPVVEAEEIDYTVKMPEGPDFCDEASKLQEERSKEIEKAREEREKMREAHREGPKKQKPDLPLSPQELQMMADDIEKHIGAIVELSQSLIDYFADGSKKRPKGVKSAVRRLEEYADAYRATHTVLLALAAADSDRVLAAVKESRLLKDIKGVDRDGKRTEKAMGNTIKQIFTALEDHDDDEAAAIARQLKQEAMRLDSPAEKLTGKLCDFLFHYPDENGELAPFSIIARDAETEDMERIDNMFRNKGKTVVAVVDAPAMIEAMKNGDDKTVQEILDRMIDNMPTT